MGLLGDVGKSAIGAGISALGGLASSALSNRSAENINLLNYKQAKEFAQNQIQWKVADAKKAGLHPLAALGMSPVMGPSATAVGDFSGIDRGLDAMGQNISRAIDSYQTQEQRDEEDRKAQELIAWEEEKRQMLRDEHKAKIAESNANVGLKLAEMNRILNPVERVKETNYVKGSSFKTGAQPRPPAKPRIKSGKEKLSSMEKMGQNREIEGNMEGLLFNSDRDTYVPLPSKARAEMAQNLGWLGHSYDALYHAGSRLGEILGASKRKPFIRDGHLWVYDKWSGEYRRTLPVRGSRRRR